jgi:hypothetical protein
MFRPLESVQAPSAPHGTCCALAHGWRPPDLCRWLRRVMRCANTVESFPPEAAMATRSPGLNSRVLTMVSWTSASKAAKKQSRQTCARRAEAASCKRERAAIAATQAAELSSVVACEAVDLLLGLGPHEHGAGRAASPADSRRHCGRRSPPPGAAPRPGCLNELPYVWWAPPLGKLREAAAPRFVVHSHVVAEA